MPPPADASGQPPGAHPVFVARGDRRTEVDGVLKQLALSPPAAGFHKYFYVARADQTVVMTLGREAPLALALRGRAGWIEPAEGS